MLVRLLMLFVVATALFVQAPEALACPAHERQASLTSSSQAPDATAALLCHAAAVSETPLCAVSGSSPLCSHFHLCCVTPPGLPASEVFAQLTPAPQTSVTSPGPADTGIHPLLDTPPPRS